MAEGFRFGSVTGVNDVSGPRTVNDPLGFLAIALWRLGFDELQVWIESQVWIDNSCDCLFLCGAHLWRWLSERWTSKPCCLPYWACSLGGTRRWVNCVPSCWSLPIRSLIPNDRISEKISGTTNFFKNFTRTAKNFKIQSRTIMQCYDYYNVTSCKKLCKAD